MYITALLIGLMGSVHCVTMCSPITLLIGGAKSKKSFIFQRLQYNLGRLVGYGILGAFAGMFGQIILLFGWQRWISVILGILFLVALFLFGSNAIHNPSFKVFQIITAWLKTKFSFIYKLQTPAKGFLIGFLNGFLPCGLVYMALLGAVTAPNFVESITFMVVFGFGTWPIMLLVSFSGGWVQNKLKSVRFKLVPYLVALLFIIRGMGLGIPYVSPATEVNNMEESIPVCNADIDPVIKF